MFLDTDVMSQKQVAERLGISEMSLSRWIRQYGIPTQRLAAKYNLVRLSEVRSILQKAGKLPVEEGKAIA